MAIPDFPVGLRNMVTPVTNADQDVANVIRLLDGIRVLDGGTEGLVIWPTDKALRIAAVAAAIQNFQTFNNLPVKDGVVDPGGRTSRELKRLSNAPPAPTPPAPTPPTPTGITIRQIPDKTGFWNGEKLDTALPSSVPGKSAMTPSSSEVWYSRRLYRVEGTSINWIGVSTPRNMSLTPAPLIYFTPTPHQGGAEDNQYDAWGRAWDDLFGTYVFYMGAQLAASTAPLVLVIPFYKNSQAHDLGAFNSNWREVVSAVVAAALDADLTSSGGPALYRDNYQFDTIYTASFSNGWYAHSAFQGKAVGASSMTKYLFDLDGRAAKPSSISWRPAKGVFYDNALPGAGSNPDSSTYHLGGRWQTMARVKGRYADFRQHWAVNQFMLYHALWQYAT